MLHYFPIESDAAATVDKGNWCGWHTDHGMITGITSAMFLDKAGRIVPCPDDTAGLYVRNRAGEIIHVTFDQNDVAFQVGEVMQVVMRAV